LGNCSILDGKRGSVNREVRARLTTQKKKREREREKYTKQKNKTNLPSKLKRWVQIQFRQ